jgi:SM-20-related protein
MDPLPIGLIISAPYQPGVTWRPTVVRGARAVLPLIDGTVLARQESEAILRIAARIAPTVVTLQGSRPEATEVAPRLLDLVDDALVSQALKTSEDCVVDRNDNIAAIAELRLRTQMARPAPAFRHLVTTPYVRIKDFLPPEEHQRVLDFALAHKDAFRDSGVVGNEGGDRKDYGVRKSQTLYGVQLESIWNFFDRRLRGILSHVRKELVLAWFPLGEIERQISAHAGGGFFVPHVDTGHPLVANRRISCVYYFYSTPQRFTGGELKLYDTWVMANKTTAAATCTTLMPVDNSLVFFPSNTFHEVCSVHRETEEFGDSRFSITIWFREGEWPASITGLTSRN